MTSLLLQSEAISTNLRSEEDLTQSLEEAMASYPDTYAVLVRRHGVLVTLVLSVSQCICADFPRYVWGDDVAKAKTQAERYVQY